MKYSLLGAVVLISILFISMISCEKEETTPNENSCDQLALKLNENIKGQNNLIVGPEDVIVGGTLTHISLAVAIDTDGKKDVRTLTFEGYKKIGTLQFKGGKDMDFHYEINKFYKFNLNNIRRNGMLSGTFLDSELNKLEEVNCSQ